MKDNPLTACPQCGKSVQRLISSPAIMFKGSGWYVTDYSDKMKPSAGNEAPATGEKKEKASTSSDQPMPSAPAAPASTPSSAPTSAPSSTTPSSSGATTATPSTSNAK
jgi:predicted nucleic acid-binding Zn ribbon protein